MKLTINYKKIYPVQSTKIRYTLCLKWIFKTILKIVLVTMYFFIYLVSALISVCSARDIVATIEPSYGPDWGEWNGGALCPDNMFAHG